MKTNTHAIEHKNSKQNKKGKTEKRSVPSGSEKGQGGSETPTNGVDQTKKEILKAETGQG